MKRIESKIVGKNSLMFFFLLFIILINTKYFNLKLTKNVEKNNPTGVFYLAGQTLIFKVNRHVL